MEVIDGHCHVASTRFIPRQFLNDVATAMAVKMASYGRPVNIDQLRQLMYRQNSDHLADELLAEMDSADIAKTILLVPDFSFAMNCDLTLEEMAMEHRSIQNRHPGRFMVFMGVDPRRGESGCKVFEEQVTSLGVQGLKLYPPCGYSPSSESLFPYYEICEHYGLPVLLHTGPTARSLDFGFSRPELIDEASRRFPGVNFILAHGGVSYVDVCVNYAKYRENIYLDIGGFTGGVYYDGWQSHLQRLFRLGVNHKIIFGSDWPISRMSGGLKKITKYFAEKGASDLGLGKRDMELVMGGNIKRILPPVQSENAERKFHYA